MKSAVRILLVALYCIVTVGMTISTHYCGPIPVASHLGSSTTEPDGCCGDAETEADCCTTVSVTIIVSDDHAGSSHEIPAPDASILILPVQDVACGESFFTHLSQPAAFPPGTSPPLTILNSCFLI